MKDGPQVRYRYDGTFAGFLTCLYDSYTRQERPAAFTTLEDGRRSRYETRDVAADQRQAQLVYASWKHKISPTAQAWAAEGFLTCLPEREMAIYRFLSLGYQVGPGVVYWLSDRRVAPLHQAVQALNSEVRAWKDTLPFCGCGGFLGGQFRPQNRVLPLLRPHLCTRYQAEQLLLYDRTHQEALFYRPHAWVIAPLAALEMTEVAEGVPGCQQLGKAFRRSLDAGRKGGPKLRMRPAPERYWRNPQRL